MVKTLYNQFFEGGNLPYNPHDQLAKPFIKWVGGKRSIMGKLIERLPKHINTYYEPFLGGGALFFALDDQISKAELSDINEHLILSYQSVQQTPEQLIDVLREHELNYTEKYYYDIRDVCLNSKTNVQLAARFIFLNKTGYNGMYRVNKNGKFNVPFGKYQNPQICDSHNIKAASVVLQKANIRHGTFTEIAPRDGDFVYADPPYDRTFTNYTSAGFDQEYQVLLRDLALKWHDSGACVMLSNSNTELIRTLYGHEPFIFETVPAPRFVNCDPEGRSPIDELLIRTY